MQTVQPLVFHLLTFLGQSASRTILSASICSPSAFASGTVSATGIECVGKCNRYDYCTDYFTPDILGVTAATTSGVASISSMSPTQSRSAGTPSIRIQWPSLVALAGFSLLL